MDLNTVTLYLAAGALSLCLSLILVGFAHLQQGTMGAKSSAVALFVLAVGFLAASVGPILPSWTTVIGTNLLLLLAATLFYSAFSALFTLNPARHDGFGLIVVALTALPFGYWGLVEPNGMYRSVVFSFAAAIINFRTARLLLHAAWTRPRSAPVWFLGGLFGTVTFWMLLRGIWLLVAPMPADQPGANPTAWVTVFGYIVLISLVAASVLWMEVSHLKSPPNDLQPDRAQAGGFINTLRARLYVLWGFVVILTVAVLAELAVAYGELLAKEQERHDHDVKVANHAFVQHTAQVLGQVDTLIKAMRGYYLQTGSVEEAERSKAELDLDQPWVEEIHLLAADGRRLGSRKDRAWGGDARACDEFVFHRDQPADELHVGPVQTDKVTGKPHFHLTRRISGPDGSFAGLVVARVKPQAFSDYFRQWLTDRNGLVALLGTSDKRVRARFPEAQTAGWDTPDQSALWENLAKQSQGTYRGTSPIDSVARRVHFERVGDLPLVIVTAASDADLRARVLERSWLLGLGALISLLVIVTLATILTLVLRQREEQERFMAMLNHELKTPMSVIRMSLGLAEMPRHIHAQVTRAVSDMNNVIERCLQSDLLRHGRIQTRRTSIRVREILQQIVAETAAPERFHVDAGDPLVCRADPRLLLVILGNLVDNALKYADAASPIRIVARHVEHAGSPGVQIAVSNLPGPAGMPEQKQVFRKYYRAPGARSKTGSGLGLYIAQGFAHKLGGELLYRPDEHEVQFWLWIPA